MAEVRQIDVPIDTVHGRFSRQLQGLCHDDESIFVVQRYRVWKFPKQEFTEKGLSKIRHNRVPSFAIPKSLSIRGFDHIGDCDVSRNRLYLPIDGGKPAKILILDSKTLSVIAAPYLPKGQEGVSWVSIDERDQSLLVGEFHFNDQKKHIRKLQLSQNLMQLSLVSEFDLLDGDGSPIQVSRVQALELDSRHNKIFLLSDVAQGGLLKFDYASKKLDQHLGISFTPPKEELEGLDVVEDNGSIYPEPGNIFVLMVKKTWLGLDGRLKLFSFFE